MQLECERTMLFCFANAYENELSLVISCDKSADANVQTNLSHTYTRAHIYICIHKGKWENKEQSRRLTQKRLLFCYAMPSLCASCVYHSLTHSFTLPHTVFLFLSLSVCMHLCLYRFLNGVSYFLHIAFKPWHMALRFASHLLTKHHTNVIKSVLKRITQAH